MTWLRTLFPGMAIYGTPRLVWFDITQHEAIYH
jgi:hypothetical protein